MRERESLVHPRAPPRPLSAQGGAGLVTAAVRAEAAAAEAASLEEAAAEEGAPTEDGFAASVAGRSLGSLREGALLLLGDVRGAAAAAAKAEGGAGAGLPVPSADEASGSGRRTDGASSTLL